MDQRRADAVDGPRPATVDDIHLARHGPGAAPGNLGPALGAADVVLPDGRAAYDGRASKEENWFERTGLARLTGERPGELTQIGDDAVRDVRYLDVLPDGGYRIWYEARLPDETHELRTELIAE